MSVPAKFTGYASKDESAGKKLDVESWSYEPQKWHEGLVDIKISHCGICGSCIHTLTNGWPSPTQYPAIAGHEIVGEVVRAGKDSGHKVGDRVGVGAQSGSCLECKHCKEGNVQFCEKGMIGTYQGSWPDGSISQGGYADYIRVQGVFALDFPKELPSNNAPLMCAGLTTYTPVRDGGAGPGKKVAIVGIGGLGHLGLQWAVALGAEAYAISHSSSKKEDAGKLGVKPEHFIIADDIEATSKKWENTFDLIVCTSFQSDLPIENLYLPLLAPKGQLTLCGLPEEKLPPITPQALVGKSAKLGGSIIGSVNDLKEMLALAVKKDVRVWAEDAPMAETEKYLKLMDQGKPRYRYVLTN